MLRCEGHLVQVTRPAQGKEEGLKDKKWREMGRKGGPERQIRIDREGGRQRDIEGGRERVEKDRRMDGREGKKDEGREER